MKPDSFVIDLLEDVSLIGWFGCGISFFTFLSFLGRSLPSLSQGMLVLFIVLHAIAILLGLGSAGIALSGNREGEVLPVLIPALIPASLLLVTLWIGCGLGAWVGGGVW